MREAGSTENAIKTIAGMLSMQAHNTISVQQPSAFQLARWGVGGHVRWQASKSQFWYLAGMPRACGMCESADLDSVECSCTIQMTSSHGIREGDSVNRFVTICKATQATAAPNQLHH